MDKRKEANLRVKRCITNALFSLMREKPLEEIFITEIIGRAGVARASFYRNYSSKEDVLTTLVRDILERFRQEVVWGPEGFCCYANILLSFRYFQTYREYVLNLYRSRYVSILLEELNQFHESIVGTMPMASVDKYGLYMYVGALLNTALVWLLEDGKTGAEEIAAFFHRSVLGITAPGKAAPDRAAPAF